jgi:hypothetical protein
VETLVQSLELFLRRNLTRILDGLKAEKVTAQEAAKALGGLESAMQDAGLAKFFDRARDLFKREYEQVQEEFEQTAGKKALLSSFSRKSLDALRDTRLDLAATYVNDYLGDVRVAVTEAVIGGRAIKPEEILDNVTGRTLQNLKTEIATTRMGFQRIVHLEKAKKAGITQFLYVGPDDDVTRPFCAEWVDRVFTLDEIAQMDNGQGLPVEVYGGGYNCRHHWRPVSDDLAAELRAEAESTEEGG